MIGYYDNPVDHEGERQAEIYEGVAQEIQGWNYARIIHELDTEFGGLDMDDLPSESDARNLLINAMFDREVSK